MPVILKLLAHEALAYDYVCGPRLQYVRLSNQNQ